MSLKGLASAFALVLSVLATVVGMSMLQSHFGWSEATMSWLFFGIGTLASVILTYKLRHLAFVNVIPIEKNRPLKLKPLHYVGLCTMAAGATLSVASITGVFVTFPYADKLVLLLGLAVYMITTPANGQSTFRANRPADLLGRFRLLAILGTCVLFLSIVGCLVDITLSTILPSDFGLSVGIGVGVVLAIGMVVLAENARSRVGTHYQTKGQFQKMLQISWIRIPVTLMLGLYIGVSGIGLGIGYGYTYLFGVETTKVFAVTGWHYGGSRRCAKPEIEGRPLLIGEKALCVSKDARLSLPVGTELKAEGRESVAGFNVNRILSYTQKAGSTN
ncbi:hypothetical protein [Methylomonas sp. DH-1]|uniref:hypothetical protein n=1 Tax=Methylomonas sp. (strain DH-1) TaxID=1727196 RepID=UPI0007C91F71|nr:hypothetical protein [Methylomonas sp. DH-1]ANE53759.1 hypothetical protein AYM39_00235 [Methylomonas sp. DH-1]